VPAPVPGLTPNTPAPPPPPAKAGSSTLHHASGGKTQTPLQKLYIEICTKKLTPSVQPDATLLHGLANPSHPTVDIVAENYSKNDLVALAKFLNCGETVNTVKSLVFKSVTKGVPGKEPKKEVAAPAPPSGPAGRRASATQVPFSLANRPPSEFIKSLARFLLRSAALEVVSIVGITLASEQIKLLTKGLLETKLHQLNVIRVPLASSFSLLTPALTGTTARCVRVVDCGIGDAGGALLGGIIRSHGARRDEMVWANNLRGSVDAPSEKTSDVSVWSAGALVLDFSGNSLSDQSAVAIAAALQNDTWLIGLNLAGNSISSKGAKALCDGLVTNKTLRALVVADNTAIDEAAEARLAGLVTAVASTPPPAAADDALVSKAMLAWSKFAKRSSRDGSASPTRRVKAVDEEVAVEVDEKKEEGAEVEVKVAATAAEDVPPPAVAAKASKTAPPAAAAPAVSMKGAVASYIAARDAAVARFRDAADSCSSSMESLCSEIFSKRGSLATKEMKALKKPPPLCTAVLSQSMSLFGAATKPANKLTWLDDMVPWLASLLKEKSRDGGFGVNVAMYALSQKSFVAAVTKFFAEGTEQAVNNAAKVSLATKIHAQLLACVFELYDGSKSAAAGEWAALIDAGQELRTTFKAKGKPAPFAHVTAPNKAVGGKEQTVVVKKKKEGGEEVVVNMPRVKVEKENKKATAAEKEPRAKSVPSGKKSAVAAAGGSKAAAAGKQEKDKDKMLEQLEGMVDKMTKEISRLESKIASTASPKKEQRSASSPGGKSRSPKAAAGSSPSSKSPSKRPAHQQQEVADPELLQEISSAVATRLKEIWSIK
jgi:hypothetical protein